MAAKPASPSSDTRLVASSLRLAIVYRRVGELKPNSQNPRVHSKKQITKIAASMREIGNVVPILTDAAGQVIAGHARLLASKELGWNEVPTIALEHLTPAQAKAFLIADNRLGELATWDEKLLGEQLKALSELDLDFSLELTGFEPPEIDGFISKLDEPATEEGNSADEVPVPAGPPISKPGDLYVAGRNRIYCGNALSAASYAELMDGKKAGMVITDLPFNVPIAGHVSGLGKVKHKNFVMATGEMNEAEFTAFLTQACRLLAMNSSNGSLHYLFIDFRHLWELLGAGRLVYGDLKNLIVWRKESGGMGSLYRSQHELVLLFKNGKGKHKNNIDLGKYGRNRTNIWEYPRPTSFGSSGEEGNLLAQHPTVKPVALIADAMLDASAVGDVVLDPFLGSGTALIAAERTGRVCYGMELDPIYVDTAIRRWQNYTGQSARHAATGHTFDQIEKERRTQQ
jgi:DNA modification methylase